MQSIRHSSLKISDNLQPHEERGLPKRKPHESLKLQKKQAVPLRGGNEAGGGMKSPSATASATIISAIGGGLGRMAEVAQFFWLLWARSAH